LHSSIFREISGSEQGKARLECRGGKINSAFAIILTVIFSKIYIVQKVMFENSTTIIIIGRFSQPGT